MKQELYQIILAVTIPWTLLTTLIGWGLLHSNKQYKKRQKIKYPYECE